MPYKMMGTAVVRDQTARGLTADLLRSTEPLEPYTGGVQIYAGSPNHEIGDIVTAGEIGIKRGRSVNNGWKEFGLYIEV
ncbi:MAG: hypothetical protein HYT72_01675 [Candidatus Aenigmarchaeota archaeon]|nr:hypothetical protein [Candidatus Aenigmarchaeota archaeon]